MTLSLRKFAKRDIKSLFAWFETEREVLQWAGAALTWPLERKDFLHLLRQHQGPESVREVWAVDRGGEVVAHFQISFNRRLNTAGLGRIAITPSQRGQGLARPLMDLITEHAFSRSWVHRADLLVYAHNLSAIKAYKHAGFTLEGTRRETTPIGSEIWDTHMMSILRREFDKRTEQE